MKNMMRNKRRTRRGVSLMEVLLASTLTVTVLAVAIGVFLSGMLSWMRGQGRIDAESGSQRAVRAISQTLREAMVVTVDSDGNGLTYRLPLSDSNGNYNVPMTWDGVTRRIFLSGGKIKVTGTGPERILCSGVISTDPLTSGGTGAYKVFTSGAGSITRSLNVMVVSQRTTDYNKTATSRSRETIYLRNIPDLYN